MPAIVTTVLLLTASNVFMTFAWYAHLKDLSHKPWIVAALISWGIALFEYLLQVPANRIGFSVLHARSAQDPAGGDHAKRVRSVCRFVYEAAAEPELPVDRAVPLRRRVVHLPRLSAMCYGTLEA